MSFSHLGISRRQFIFGLGAGAIATLPLVYSDIPIISNIIKEIFFSLSFISESFLGFSVFFSLVIFFLFVFTVFFLLQKIFSHKTPIYKYVVSFGGLIFLILCYSLLLYVFSLFSGSSMSETRVESGDFMFVGVLSILGYYIIISLLEEGMKYISNMNLLPKKEIIRFESMLASGAVVALGFSFFENILYAYSYFRNSGIDGELLRLVFFRSLFTVALHILCAMLLSAGFYMLIVLRGKYNNAYSLFVVFSIIAIISHAFFDVALTFGYIGVVFLYLFFLYIFVGYITSSD